MRNYNTPVVAILMLCALITIALVISKKLEEFNATDNKPPQKEQLLTLGRTEAIRTLAADKLLNDNSDVDSQFNDMFRFLSLLDDNCASLLTPELDLLLRSPYLKSRMESIQEKLRQFNVVEGFSEQVRPQVAFYALLARQPWVRQVCEIGFNAGHSALYWLAASNVTRLLSFDLGAHDYTSPMAQYMSTTFPDRFKIVLGDSTKTVPQFVANIADKPLACDVIVVDGGHDYEVAKADLQSMRAFARSPRHLLIVDDTPCVPSFCQNVGRAWREARHLVKPLFGCMGYPLMDRGFSVGYYVS